MVYNLYQPSIFLWNDFSGQTGFKVFSSPWAIYRCVAANMKVIKTQSDPNLSYFPMEALRPVWPQLLSFQRYSGRY